MTRRGHARQRGKTRDKRGATTARKQPGAHALAADELVHRGRLVRHVGDPPLLHQPDAIRPVALAGLARAREDLANLVHLKAQQVELSSNGKSGQTESDGHSDSEKDSTCLQFLEFAMVELSEAYKKSVKDDDETSVWMTLGMELLRVPELHNQTVELYLEEIVQARRRVHVQEGSCNDTELSEKQQYMRGPVLPASKESGHSGSLRRRLLKFLQSSKHYQPEKLLSKFQLTNMLEERALLLRSAGRHEEALQTRHAHPQI